MFIDTGADIDDSSVTFKVECRDVKSIESSNAELKGVFTIPWPLLLDLDSFKEEVKDRFGVENITALYYYDGLEVMSITSTQDLQACLRYFKTCTVTYRNWQGFSRIYAVISKKDASFCGEHSQTHGQCSDEVNISVRISEFVNCVLESLAITTVFNTEATGDDNTLMRFAFRVHTQYGSQVTVASPDVAFCESCRKSIRLNKPF